MSSNTKDNQDQLISVILAFSRSWVKNSYTNVQLRAIVYTDKKRSASHLATAAKLYTCMSLIKHNFFQKSHHSPTRVLPQSAIERYNPPTLLASSGWWHSILPYIILP